MSGGQRARCSISRILTNHRTVDMPRQRTGKRFGLGSAREPWGAAVREQILGGGYRACGCKGNLFGSCPSRHTAKTTRRIHTTPFSNSLVAANGPQSTSAETGQPELEERGKAIPEERR